MTQSHKPGILAIVLLTIFITSACTASDQNAAVPEVSILSPVEGTQLTMGDEVSVQATAHDALGVFKIELWVDGRFYTTAHNPQPAANTPYTAILPWTADVAGQHILTVKAHNVRGAVSAPASCTVQVTAPLPTATPAPAATPEENITPVPTQTPQEGECVYDAAFLADVTVPDDTEFTSGTAFDKVWRYQNNGTCPWPKGTAYAFIGGDKMGAPNIVPVDEIAPGQIIEITVTMTAPTVPATYTGYWQMRLPNGELFGDQAYVRIVVPTP
ncbi:MAG: hypothetical protein H5T62_12820 [Anaerolineae bacterium]|nr:hypothetical protein [Anaerolineae bacterium]